MRDYLDIITDSEASDYICVGPNRWGRGGSQKEAQRRCGGKSKQCVVYETHCDDVRISGIDGSLSWPKGEQPPVIVWMGSEFATRNPEREVGQADGDRNE